MSGWIFLLSLLLLVTFPARSPAGSSGSAPSDQLCFPETGQCISGRFLAFWQQNGGLPIFGYPITAARPEVSRETGGTYLTQWFERSRFEQHPENRAPYDVLLGRVGDDALLLQGRSWWSEGREPGPKDGCRWFEETGHNLCDVAPGLGFQSYWEQHGLRDLELGSDARSLALLGLPLSEARLEINPDDGQPYMIQWFERARFEYHAASAGDSQVLLGLLGNDLLGRTTPRYLWLGTALPGLVVQPQGTRADNSGFVVALSRSSDGQPGATITGGPGFFSPPPRGPGVALTIRGQPGTAVTSGGVTFISWTEYEWPYTISGGLSQDELINVAEHMELLPLVHWQEQQRALPPNS
jgi:hypothetical protein